MAEKRLKHGRHPDPLDPLEPPPDRSTWSARQVQADASAAMAAYREALLVPGITDVRAAVLDDLSSYFSMDPAECVRRCVEWEDWAVEEWKSRDRDSSEGLLDFYLTTRSWSFDLLWYAYLQATGYRYPVSVAIADTLRDFSGTRHLDFGSGVGVTSQLFHQLGYRSTSADISTALLEFSTFRFARRNAQIGTLDLNEHRVLEAEYDVITAIDTLVHIPVLQRVVSDLHRALRPDGLLFANFDVRPRTLENHAFLYADDRPLRLMLHRTGFEPEENLDGMITRYRRVKPSGVAHQVRGVRDVVQFGPLRPLYKRARDVVTRRH